MDAARHSTELGSPDLVPSCGRIDFILARMKDSDVSGRQIATLTGIRKSRISAILHSDAEKRSPVRMDEFEAILRVLNISHVEVTLAAELIDKTPHVGVGAIASVASMLSEVMNGLPIEVIEMLDGIGGIDHADVRKEHAVVVRKMIVDFLTSRYTRFAQLRDMREADIGK